MNTPHYPFAAAVWVLATAFLAVSCQFMGRQQTASIEGKEVDDSEIVALELSEPEAISAAELDEVVEVPATEQQKQPDAWYDHDFSLTVVMHKYVNVSTPLPQADETVLVTRMSDKAYIQSSVQEVVRKCTTLEPIPEGYRETIFKNGKVDWTHDFDNGTLNYQLAIDFGMTICWPRIFPRQLIWPRRKRQPAAAVPLGRWK